MTKPDWREFEDYAFADNLTPEGWAWEFLRRNGKYKRAYLEFKEKVKQFEAELGSDWAYQGETMFPAQKEGESENAWKLRCSETSGHSGQPITLEKKHAQLWGLKDKMFDPDLGIIQGVKFLSPKEFPQLLTSVEAVEEFIEEYDAGPQGLIRALPYDKTFCAFDLKQDLKHQIKVAKLVLEKLQNELFQSEKIKTTSPRNHKVKWKRYLRILDAEDAEISPTEIGETIGGWSKIEDRHIGSQVQETLTLAQEIVETRYRNILLLKG